MLYEHVLNWGNSPWNNDITGIAVDKYDNVYCLVRKKREIIVNDEYGNFIRSWTHKSLSERPHFISIGSDDFIYLTDDGSHQIHIFNQYGRLIETIGSGIPSDTGYNSGFSNPVESYNNMHGGPPFNRPTKAVLSSNGDIAVSDGYRNNKIHIISRDRSRILSWGRSGSSPGSFVIPHSVYASASGEIYVCDRENDRIQIFNDEGKLLNIWNSVQRPTDITFDSEGLAYVTELPRGPKDIQSWQSGIAKKEILGSVSVRSRNGILLHRIFDNFLAPHAIAVDSKGSIYISEVPESFHKFSGRESVIHCCLRKYVRV